MFHGTDWLSTLNNIVYIAFGLSALGTGLWGFIKKRPLIFPARYLMGLVIAWITPTTLRMINFLFDPSLENELITCVFPLAVIGSFALLIYIFWRQTPGYILLGVSDESFRNGLTNALKQLNFPFEESVSKIRLTSLKADLQVSVSAWMGTAQMRIKQPESAGYTEDIVIAMNEYFQDNAVSVNNTAFVSELLIGVSMIVLVIIMLLI